MVEYKSPYEATHPPNKISKITSLSASEAAKLTPYSLIISQLRTQHLLCQRKYCKRGALVLLKYLIDKLVENMASESIVWAEASCSRTQLIDHRTT